jgi:quinol monooxygenase YgiN
LIDIMLFHCYGSKNSYFMKQAKPLAIVLIGLLAALIGLNPFSSSFAVTPSLADSSEPIHVIGRMSVKFDQAERSEFDQLTHILFEMTRQYDEPLLYTCNEDINASGTFVWDEIWSSKSSFDSHLSSNHFKAWWSWVEPHLSGDLQVFYVDQSELKQV